MAIVNGYITRQELQGWQKSSSTANIPDLERAINACSRGIDQWCQRHFWQTASLPRLFAPDNPTEFDLGPFNDLHEITSLATDESGDGTFETPWAAGDYELLPLNQLAGPEQQPYTSILSTGTRTFPYLARGSTGRSGRVQITGKWGWAAVPDAVAQACLIQSARVFRRKDSPDGVSNWGEFGVIRVGRTDPDVVAMLEDYRLVRRVGMVRVR